jgi:hypothetical protein
MCTRTLIEEIPDNEFGSGVGVYCLARSAATRMFFYGERRPDILN